MSNSQRIMYPAQQKLENLRRSTRTVVLQQQVKQLNQTVVSKETKKETKKTFKAKLKDKRKSLKRKKAKVLEFRYASKKGKKSDDDGFILDDPANDIIPTQPLKEFDELELWRRYQKEGNEGSQDTDDGFILDVGDAGQGFETTRPQFREMASMKPATLVRKKQKYMKKEIQVTAGKKLSKKKRKRAERKWLKKLFHESVIIAEPQDSETNNQSGALSSNQNPEDMSEAAMTVAVETSASAEITHSAEAQIASNELKSQTKHTIPSESFSSSSVKTIHPSSLDTDIAKTGNVVKGDRTQPLATLAPKVATGKGKPETVASEDGRKLRADWERALKESGMSNFEWSQHLLNLHEIHCKSCSHSPQHRNSNSKGELSTTYVDMTSGKSDPDDRKKRYKMELSLPEGTTILVTNLVERDSTLPKVIFMLKKTTANGETQESPLLMGCSNDSSRQKDQPKTNANLESELQEIAKQFLRVQSGVVSSSNANDPLLSIPKALEFNME